MATLYRYFKDLWKLAVVALVLAAINQIFPLVDPLIFRHIIDSYATRYRDYSSPQFIRGVGLLLAAAVGVSRIASLRKRSHSVLAQRASQASGSSDRSYERAWPAMRCISVPSTLSGTVPVPK